MIKPIINIWDKRLSQKLRVLVCYSMDFPCNDDTSNLHLLPRTVTDSCWIVLPLISSEDIQDSHIVVQEVQC